MSTQETALTQADRQAAIAEFRQSYGFSPNVEELIRANNLALSQATTEASLLPVDQEATAELDYGDLEGKTTVGGITPSDAGKVVAAAVRGDAIIVVIETPDGRKFKDVIPANDRYTAPKEPAAAVLARAQQEQDAEVARRVQELRDEMAVEIAKLRAELAAKQGEEIAKAQEEAGEKVTAAAEEAEKAEAEAEEEAAPATTSGRRGRRAAASSEES